MNIKIKTILYAMILAVFLMCIPSSNLEVNASTSVNAKNIADANITIDSYYAKGIAITPEIRAYYSGEKLNKGVDYEIGYCINNLCPGEATVKIIGIGDYRGSVTKNFQIKSRTVTEKKLPVDSYNSMKYPNAVVFETISAGQPIVLYVSAKSGLNATLRYSYSGAARGSGKTNDSTIDTSGWGTGTKTLYISYVVEDVELYRGQYTIVGTKTMHLTYKIKVTEGAASVPQSVKLKSVTAKKPIEIDDCSIFLSPEINPVGANVWSMSWSSSNPDCATVDDGMVTIHSQGKTKIQVVVNDYETVTWDLSLVGISISERCEITGYDSDNKKIQLKCKEYELIEGIDYKQEIINEDDESITLKISGMGLYSGAIYESFSKSSGEVLCSNHEWNDGEVILTANCARDGYKKFTCTKCNTTKEIIIPMNSEHQFQDPVYTLSDDHNKCTATRICANDPEHIETETVITSFRDIKAADCTNGGTREYYASFTNKAFESEHVMRVEVPALGHMWDYAWYEWSKDYKKCTAIHKCKNNNQHYEKETVDTISSVKIAPTSNSMGMTTYKAVFKNAGFEIQTEDVWDIPEIEETETSEIDSDDKYKDSSDKYQEETVKDENTDDFVRNNHTLKTTKLTKLKSKKKSITVKWKKQTDSVSGYEIQYCTNKRFNSKTKTITIGKPNEEQKTIKRLKSGKKYYIRIRTYAKCNGNKVFSNWSKTKSIRTK
jgi:hypothetical protein